ncbi:MAG: type III restriction endonuclease subunit R, partial [Nitrospirae bacterium]|nr:type III restriction endonuclease subunit R [Nitrospirota bacterium]
DYVSADGSISNYYPDFIVKANENEIYIVETKGVEDLDVPLKMERLKCWCADINASQKKHRFDFVFVDEEEFERYKPDDFTSLVKSFRRYKED